MGKRYYCDYCDRSFKDHPEARKKHLTSLLHVTARTEHYNLFKGPEDILKEELKKVTCKKFYQSGECQFGSNCRFSHYTSTMMWELRQMVAMKKEAEVDPKLEWPNPSEIAQEYFENTTNDDNDDKNIEQPIWNIPVELQNFPNLPPSLWPINAETMTDPISSQWA